MIKVYPKIIISALLLLAAVISPVFADVKAYLNQSDFFEGDPVTLKIETTTNSNAKPDLSPLQKDFTIIGTSANSQISIMNGQRTFKKSWTVELQPNKKGKLQIPSITLGDKKTNALSLVIADLPPEVTAETSKHIFIETSINTEGKSTFVQQQIPYTVKLFYDATMQTAQIQTPVFKNANLEKLGADKRYEVVRAGKRFSVVEKRFVISPEKSGTLHIPPASVTGRIALSGGDSQTLRRRMDETDMLNNFFNDFRNDPFFKDSFAGGFLSSRSRGPSKPFTLRSESIDVDVLPVPDAFTGSSWLPAEDLVIKDSWATNPPDLKVGVPVTRSLTLQAKGLDSSQIPDIVFPTPKNIKSYPDKAKSETRTDGNTVYGIQHTEINYIPDTAGKITIPKIKVDWWDVKKKKQRTFVLPAWNLNVAPDLSDYTNPEDQNTPSANNSPETSIESNAVEKIDNNPTLLSNISEKYWGWRIIIAAPLALILFAYLIYRYNYRRKKQHKPLRSKMPTKKTQDAKVVHSVLLQACKNNNKQQAATKLITYAQIKWQDDSVQNLGNLAARLSHGSGIVRELEQSLYSINAEKWDGKALAKLLEDGLQQKQMIKPNLSDGLTPLYPA
jgi:hypothetical protein